jgi:D-alanyl-D-alanine carboxypeptidase/D-alanyl-D-alanine-endopeptidase (penicillin-binding protein 4)
VLYEAAPGTAVIPASTMKLVTAATVLTHLDASEVLRTTVRRSAPVTDGVLVGDLWLVGGGDPVLATAGADQAGPDVPTGDEPAVRTSFEALADGVAASGIRSVQGRVLGDESRYDALRGVPSWPARYQQRDEVGPLSALTVNDGFVPAPAAGPTPTRPRSRRRRRPHRAAPGPGGSRSSVPPARAWRRRRCAPRWRPSTRPPVLALVGQMLRESDNGTAELLLKEVGHRVAGDGSTAAGATVAEDTLASLELPMEGRRRGRRLRARPGQPGHVPAPARPAAGGRRRWAGRGRARRGRRHRAPSPGASSTPR